MIEARIITYSTGLFGDTYVLAVALRSEQGSAIVCRSRPITGLGLAAGFYTQVIIEDLNVYNGDIGQWLRTQGLSISLGQPFQINFDDIEQAKEFIALRIGLTSP